MQFTIRKYTVYWSKIFPIPTIHFFVMINMESRLEIKIVEPNQKELIESIQ
jgi:hypothetical protein